MKQTYLEQAVWILYTILALLLAEYIVPGPPFSVMIPIMCALFLLMLIAFDVPGHMEHWLLCSWALLVAAVFAGPLKPEYGHVLFGVAGLVAIAIVCAARAKIQLVQRRVGDYRWEIVFYVLPFAALALGALSKAAGADIWFWVGLPAVGWFVQVFMAISVHGTEERVNGNTAMAKAHATARTG